MKNWRVSIQARTLFPKLNSCCKPSPPTPLPWRHLLLQCHSRQTKSDRLRAGLLESTRKANYFSLLEIQIRVFLPHVQNFLFKFRKLPALAI